MVNANFLCGNLDVDTAIESSFASIIWSNLSDGLGGDDLGVVIGDVFLPLVDAKYYKKKNIFFFNNARILGVSNDQNTNLSILNEFPEN